MNKNIVILVVLAIAVAIGVFAFTGSKKPGIVEGTAARSVGSEFVRHASAGHLEMAYNMLHKNLKATLPLEQFGKIVADNKISSVTSVNWEKAEAAKEATSISGTAQNGVKVLMQVTEEQNEGKPGIIRFRFEPVEAAAPAKADPKAKDKK